MINNWPKGYRLVAPAWLSLMLVGCAERRLDADTFQGVVEYEERDLAFEVTGRITAMTVHEGDQLAPQGTIARLAPELERSALAARESEARAAAEQLDLLKAGSRPEDIRVLAARVDAARAAEALRRATAERTRKLAAGQAATQAALDEAEAQLQRAQADSRAAEESLRAGRSGARIQEVGAARDRLSAAQATSDMQRERVSRYELRALEAGEVLEVHLRTGEVAVARRCPWSPSRTPRTRTSTCSCRRPRSAASPWATRAARAHRRARPRRCPDTSSASRAATEFTPRFLFSERERPNLVVRVRVRVDDPKRELHAGVPAFVHARRAASRRRRRRDRARADRRSRPSTLSRRFGDAGRGARRVADASTAARSSACSARTAPASRRRSACCAASSTRPAAAARVVGFDIATRGRAHQGSASAT